MLNNYIIKAYRLFSRIIAVVIVKLIKRIGFLYYKNIWIFGAFAGNKYGDNSAVFFEYINSLNTDIQSYWVISRTSNDIEKICQKGKFLYRNSIKCNIYVLLAKVHIYSHGTYDISGYKITRLQNNFKVYLSHGVHGFKKLKIPSKLETINQMADMFLANSDFERYIKQEIWGIDKEKIFMSCLPRFDRLIKLRDKYQSKELQKQILYMPTWRDWLLESNDFNSTDYFKNIKEFLLDKQLNEYLYKNNIVLKLAVHVHMEEFIDYYLKQFNLSNIQILDKNVDLQDELAKSSLLITDYSSVTFDILYMNKPTVFYIFDYEIYKEYRGSYIDISKDAYGPITYTPKETINIIKKIVENDFIIPEDLNIDLSKSKDKYFRYNDNNNCKRLINKIIYQINKN